MIKFYSRPYCPYCAIVRATLKELGVPYEELDIGIQKNLDELLSRGGKRQVPFIVDSDRNVAMYESRDIANYLHTTYPIQHYSHATSS